MAGFVKTNADIKLLVLYIMASCEEPLTFEELYQLALCDEGVNYFLLKQSLDELMGPENIILEGTHYFITQRGRDNFNLSRKIFPVSVKQKSDEELKRFRSAKSRKKYIKCGVVDNPDTTCMVEVAMLDPKGVVFDLKLLAPDRKQGDAMAKAFDEDPSAFFHAILSTAQQLACPTEETEEKA